MVEPPKKSGRVKMPRIGPQKGRPIAPDKAASFAEQWVGKYSFFQKNPYAAVKALKTQAPLLVSKVLVGGHYYIVPFAKDKQTPNQKAVMVVNAYDGAFEQVSVFKKETHYLTKDEAIKAARQYAKTNIKTQNDITTAPADASLMWKPCAESKSPLSPFWEVKLTLERVYTLYVDQTARVHEKLTDATPGG